MSTFRMSALAAWPRERRHLAVPALVAFLSAFFCATWIAPAGAEPASVRLEGHVLPALAESAPVSANVAPIPLTLTVVLRRSDEAGFRRFLGDVYDRTSAKFHRFLDASAQAERFGPAASDYAAVRDYFLASGFTLTAESSDRLTMSFAGDSAQAAQALGVAIDTYRAGNREFFANDRDPVLPAAIAEHVQAITGLSNLAVPAAPMPMNAGLSGTSSCYKNAQTIQGAGNAIVCGVAYFFLAVIYDLMCIDPINWLQGCKMVPLLPGEMRGPESNPQKVGIVAFDSYLASDVADFLALVGAPPAQLDQLSLVEVNGGANVGPNASEVLLDIDTLMMIAPSASYVVYSAPFTGNTSFQAIFNRMIGDGVTIISNSWTYCEDQTSLADVESIDSILQTAAAAGITVFNASGDTGATCLDGSANTVGVPASSPHATAVGGTSMQAGPGAIYGGETWWNGQSSTPVTGQGGYGVSRFFARPAYQDGFNAGAMRSVPDLSVNADPAANGVSICQASAGGCPSPLLYGGTSISAPTMAAFMANLNAAAGSNAGELNPAVYPLGASGVFHPPASMGSDFAHVGLGSPNISALYLALTGGAAGATSATLSIMSAVDAVAVADPAQPTHVLVQLRDGNGSAVAGKTVALAGSAGNHATISPPSATSDASNGVATFTVSDGTIEDVVFSAHSVSDNLDLAATATVHFVAPPAASGGIVAFPTTVAADGVAATTITVTLHDAENHPTPGKVVALSQAEGRSVIASPDPPVTDANGEIAFTATDRFEESVTYTATDVTDGDVPVPGSATVTYSGSAAGSCATAPSAADGYAFTSYINGFASVPFFFGNVNFGCAGASSIAFDANGNGYVVYFPTGALYRFGPDGGVATAPLSTLGPTLSQPVFGRDGRLYATHSATTGDFTTGDLVEIDPDTGAQLRVLATNLTCPQGLATDPLSGDLFFDDACTGAGSDNPSIFRVSNPASATPTLSVYATMPATPNGALSIAPDGTIYVVVGYYANPFAPVYSVTGTNQPMPPIAAPVADVTANYWVKVGAADATGAASSLIVLDNLSLETVDLADTTLRTPLATNIGAGTIGTDDCMYPSSGDVIYRLAPTAGACAFATTNPSPALALAPRTVSPNPTQGGTAALTATISNLAVPPATPVRFVIEGANAEVRMARTDAAGVATLTYQGRFAGDDVITALATVDGTDLVSNVARVTWDAGPHATFVAILGTTGALAGQPVTLTASLTDAATTPQAAIAGASLAFSVGGQGCSAATGANGVASCAVTLASAGAYTLTVSYAGTASLLPSSATTLFVVPPDNVDLIFADGFDGPH